MNILEIIDRYDLVYQGELVSRIILAACIGYFIGYERKNREKSAGMRTHAIVCMGAALMMVVSKYGFKDIPDYDASRVAAQIVSGVGFLGAGMIFVRNNAVNGLTTAAGIWTTAGVGMAIGAGAYFIGVCSGILVLFTQILLHKTSFFAAEPYRSYLKVTTSNYEKVMADLRAQFKKDKIREVGIKITKNKSKEETKIELDLFFPAKYEKSGLIYRLAENEDILAVSG